jgi:DNA alkylation repair enzyme
MPLTAAAISRKLREHAHPENVAILQRFFKTGPGQYAEGDRFIGVKVPSLRTVSVPRHDAGRDSEAVALTHPRGARPRVADARRRVQDG